jgi:hypothetical protein
VTKKKEEIKFHIPKSVEEKLKKMKEREVNREMRWNDRIDISINSVVGMQLPKDIQNHFAVRRIRNNKESRYVITSTVMIEYFTGKGKAPELAKKLIEETPLSYKCTEAMIFIRVLKSLEKIDGSKLKIFVDNVKIGQLKSDWTDIEWEY